MTTEEAAEAVIDCLQTSGWYQGAARGPDDQVCIMTALAITVNDTELFLSLAGRLMKHAWHEGFGTTAAWNDHSATTYEDVILALKHAGHP